MVTSRVRGRLGTVTPCVPAARGSPCSAAASPARGTREEQQQQPRAPAHARPARGAGGTWTPGLSEQNWTELLLSRSPGAWEPQTMSARAGGAFLLPETQDAENNPAPGTEICWCRRDRGKHHSVRAVLFDGHNSVSKTSSHSPQFCSQTLLKKTLMHIKCYN